jgi:hypothetical protein
MFFALRASWMARLAVGNPEANAARANRVLAFPGRPARICVPML